MKLEMRTLKNIAAAAMTLVVVFGAASLKPVTANAAEASGSASIEEENSYISFQDEAYQNEFLRRVNNERAKAGLKPVQLGDSSHNSAAQERAEELAVSYSYASNYRQEVLNLVNAERAKYGLQPLVMGDAKLTAAAQQRAEEIATVNSHVRPNGTKWYTVLSEYGVTDAAAGENAAWGSVSPEEVVNAWMNSEGHRANILDPEARAMGVGYYYNSSSTWGHQWIQLFTK